LNTASRAAPALASDSVDWLFGQLVARLGPEKVGRMCGSGEHAEKVTRAAWAEELAGFTVGEIKRGLHEVAMRRFPPTLGEFAQWCRPCLDPEAAWMEAEHCLRQREDGLRGDWTHPAVFRAASTMGNEVRSGDFQRYRARWTAALKRELAAGWGDGVPPPVQRIAYTEGKPVPAPEAARTLARLMREEQAHRRERRRQEAARRQEEARMEAGLAEPIPTSPETPA